MFKALLLSLAASGVSIIQLESTDFQVTIFWPLFFLSILYYGSFKLIKTYELIQVSLLASVFCMSLTWLIFLSENKSTSVGLSIAFLIYGQWIIGHLSLFETSQKINALKIILISFAISSIAALVLLYFGLEDSPLSLIAQTYYDRNNDNYRIQGLTSEPSYAAFIVAMSLLGLLRLDYESNSSKKNILFFTIISIFIIILARSVYGFILIVIVVSPILNVKYAKNYKKAFTSFLFFVSIVLVVLILTPYFGSEGRVDNILQSIMLFNLEALKAVDTSAYMRIGPFISYILLIDVTDIKFWFGHGVGSSNIYFGSLYGYLAGNDIITMRVGFFPGFIYDYGLISTIAMISFIFTACAGKYSLQAKIVCLLLLFNANINTQLFWYMFTCMIISIPLSNQLRFSLRRRDRLNMHAN